MSLNISTLGGDTCEKWDDFVDSHPESTFFHRSGWKRVIEKAFGHKTYFLYAIEDQVVVGVLPLAHINSVVFGSSLVSTPFCVYGGIVANRPDVAQRLRQAACDIAKELKVNSLELRNLGCVDGDWPRKELYVTFRKQIVQDPEKVLLSIPNKQRAVVRKGIKAGLSSGEGWHSRRMFNVYAESLRDLGTPVFTRHYFDILREVFADDCRTLMIQHKGNDVAGVLSFYFRDQILPYYAGSTALSRGLHAHGYMYWSLMRNASEQGVKLFDFGRSKLNTGSYSFKKNWGFEPQALDYEYFLANTDSVPDVNPLNPKYQVFIKAWKNLPLPIANRFGPWLARSLG